MHTFLLQNHKFVSNLICSSIGFDVIYCNKPLIRSNLILINRSGKNEEGSGLGIDHIGKLSPYDCLSILNRFA